jgi:hypothetical protein
VEAIHILDTIGHISFKTLGLLLAALGLTPLFPNLQSTQIYVDQPGTLDFLPYLLLFAGPKTSYFSVSSWTYQSDWSEDQRSTFKTLVTTFMVNLKTRCPLLMEISIPEVDCAQNSLLVHSVRSWTDLRALEVDAMLLALLPHLAGFPSLETLEFRPPLDVHEPSMMSVEEVKSQLSRLLLPTHHSFPSLQPLTIKAESLAFAIAFMSVLGPCRPLKTLSLQAKGGGTPEELWIWMLDLIVKNISPTSLMTLYVQEEDMHLSTRVSSGSAHHRSIPHSSISPLSKFTELSSLSLAYIYGFETGDKDIEVFSRSWNQMRELEIRNAPGMCREPSMTMEGLLRLTRNCPDLQRLEIGFNTRKGKIPEVIGKPFSCLEELSAVDSPIEDGESVVEEHLRAFPRLKRLFANGIFDAKSIRQDPMVEEWGYVSYVIRERLESL